MRGRGRPISIDAALSNTLFILLLAATGFVLVWDGLGVPLVTYIPFADYWEHTAALTEWMRNLAEPGNPHVLSADSSARFMPYFWLLSVIGQLFSLTAVQLMSLSLVINFCLIGLGINLFFRSYFRDPMAPLFGFIAIFMFWGLGSNGSNLFQLRSFVYVGGYPSAFAFGLSLVAFWATLKFLRHDGSPVVTGALLALLGTLMLLCHPLTAVFGLGGCLLLAVTEQSAPVGLRLGTVGIVLFAAIAAELWPHFSVWKLILGQYGPGIESWPALRDIDPTTRFQSGAWAHLFYNPAIVLSTLGPALLGIPVIVWLWLKREHRFIVWGGVLMAIPYFLNLFFQVPLGHRFLLFVAFYLQLALVWFILTLFIECRAEPKPAFGTTAIWATTMLLFAAVGGNAALLAGEYRGESVYPRALEASDKSSVLPPGENVVSLYERITAPIADDAVVLTTASLGWPLPSVKGKVVSLYHENPLLQDQLDRYKATADFFYRPIDAEQRAQIVSQYGATHLLVSDRDANIKPEVGEWLSRHGQLITAVDSYRMYRIKDNLPRIVPESVVRTAPARVEPAPTEAPVLHTAQIDDRLPERPARIAMQPEGDRAESSAEANADVVDPPEVAASFGAPIASPIVNLPEPDPVELLRRPEAMSAVDVPAAAEAATDGAPALDALAGN